MFDPKAQPIVLLQSYVNLIEIIRMDYPFEKNNDAWYGFNHNGNVAAAYDWSKIFGYI